MAGDQRAGGGVAVRPRTQRKMACARCGTVYDWTAPSFVPRGAVIRLQGGDGNFPNRMYAVCWRCWEREHLQDAMRWAKRSWLARRKAWR